MKEIKLTQGYVTQVDDEDYDELVKFRWFLKRNTRNSYAVRNRKQTEGYGKERKTIRMHRQIMGVSDKLEYNNEIDHIDGNGLNNQKSNLRFCTRTQNSLNCKKALRSSSIYYGVHLDNRNPVLSKPWRSFVSVEGKTIKMGYFKTEIEAAKSRDKFIIDNHLEFHKLNF